MNNILKKPFAWSFSAINNFETCARQYHEIDVLKNFKKDFPEGNAGLKVHDAMAKRIEDGTPLPGDMPFEKWIFYATKDPGHIMVEQKLAITRTFKPCEYFDRQVPVWFRTVADVVRINPPHAHVIDWKTGKVKPDKSQLKLIASAVMAHYPKILRVKAEFIWLAHDTQTTEYYTEDDIVTFWEQEMFPKVRRLRDAHDTNNFPPKPSGLCKRYCPVTSCEHCGQ